MRLTSTDLRNVDINLLCYLLTTQVKYKLSYCAYVTVVIGVVGLQLPHCKGIKRTGTRKYWRPHKLIAQITVFDRSEPYPFCRRILPYSRELKAGNRY